MDYIALELGTPDAAISFLDALDAAVAGLAELPYRYPIYHTRYAFLEGIRWMPVKRYMVFYKVFEADRTVEIRRILHQLQDVDRHIGE